MLSRVVYLPCELKSRDLESRMLIAAHLLKRGTPVLFGQMWTLGTSYALMPPGCVAFATANKIQAAHMVTAKKHGHVVIGYDQEALPIDGKVFLVNVDPLAAKTCDRFLVTTKSHEEVLRTAYPKLPIEVVGSPRVDILRTANPSRPIVEPYVLFNTSFAMTNSVWGSVELAMEAVMRGGGQDPQSIRDRYNFEVASKNELMGLLRWAADNLPWRIVVRPHPAERVEAWKEFASDKVSIISGESPIPWIKHAKFVVHANSTTGLEAALLGTPCLNICPAGHDRLVDQFIIRRLNTSVRSAQEAVEAIALWMQTGKGMTSTAPAETFPPNSAERIAEVANRYVAACPSPPQIQIQPAFRSEQQKAKFTVTADEIVNCFNAINPIGAPGARVSMVEDSLFYLWPS
jgi:surface carbohydrate biosynthesis protein